MRILQLAERFEPTSAWYTQFVVPWLEMHEVTLCTRASGERPRDDRLASSPGSGSWRHFWRRLRRLLRAADYDLVQIHTPGLAACFLLAALWTRPRLIGKSVLHLHVTCDAIALRHRCLLLFALPLLARLVCCGHAVRRSLPVITRLLAGRRLTTICNGVDLGRVDRCWTRRRLGTIDRTEDLQLVSVGRLDDAHNHAAALHALAASRTRDVRLTIIGDGPDRHPLQALAGHLGIEDRVHFAGRASRQRTLRLLWRADGFVSMARHAGLPLCVLEAMSCHCPVLLSNIPAHREIRGRRRDLIPLLAPDDHQELAEAFSDWATMPLDVLRAWGADCRQHVEWDYSLQRVLEQFELLLEEFDPVETPEWKIFCRSVLINQRRQRRAA